MFACLLLTGSTAETAPDVLLLDVAQQYSPRVAWAGAHTLVLDLTGLERLFGDVRTIGESLRGALADRGLQAHVALASTQTAAQVLAHARAGLTVVAPGEESAALAPLSIDLLQALEASPVPALARVSGPRRFYRSSPVQELVRPRRRRLPHSSVIPHSSLRFPHSESLSDLLPTLRRWGLRTLGELAGLPPGDLAARLGPRGTLIQAMARGEDAGPLVPLIPDERFESRLELEWPIEGLEPLSFVLSRLAEPVCSQLDRRGRAATVLHVELRLVTRETWTRRLDLPAPIKDPRVLRTLALLDLESNPPPAGIDIVILRVEPTPARSLQHSLLERARPAPEQVSTLVARLSALMGDSRVGSPVLVDSHKPGAFQMTRFTGDSHLEAAVGEPQGCASGPAFRRFRHPIVAEVSVGDGRPLRVHVTRPGVTGGGVTVCAGPWRTSGDWWGSDVWDHDEWDVDLDSGAVCRLVRDRRKNRWYVEGVYD